MNASVYRFTVGAFDCICLSDSAGALDIRWLFSGVDPDELAYVVSHSDTPPDAYETSVNILYVNTGQHRVLVDTGSGEGGLAASLQAAGLAPADIDTIVLTHCHGDHIGGLVNADGGLAFPNARYFMRREEWQFWTSEEGLAQLKPEAAARARRCLPPIRDRLTLIEQDEEILPGIQAVFAPGHTPGHIALLLESDGAQLLHLADAVHQPIQVVYPHWSPVFDMQHHISPVTRRNVLLRAAETGALVLAYHFPFPGLGHVTGANGAWSWQRL